MVKEINFISTVNVSRDKDGNELADHCELEQFHWRTSGLHSELGYEIVVFYGCLPGETRTDPQVRFNELHKPAEALIKMLAERALSGSLKCNDHYMATDGSIFSVEYVLLSEDAFPPGDSFWNNHLNGEYPEEIAVLVVLPTYASQRDKFFPLVRNLTL